MKMNLDNFNQAFAETLLHSIWQGTLVVFIIALMIRYGKWSNTQKFNILYGGAMSFLILAIVTFWISFDNSLFVSHHSKEQVSSIIQFAFSPPESEVSNTSHTLPISSYLLKFWVIGFFVFFMKNMISFLYSAYLVSPKERKYINAWQRQSDIICNRLSVNKISVFGSNRINTPLVFGWLKPLVLLPVSYLTLFDPEEIEIILSHEISHVMRNDWILNIILSILETLFFYHPGMWWLVKKIREEREYAVDQQVLHSHPNQIKYARTLVKAQELSLIGKMPLTMAPSLFQSKKELTKRIKLIFDQSEKQHIMKGKLMTLALVLCIGSAYAFTTLVTKSNDSEDRSTTLSSLHNSGITSNYLAKSVKLDTIPKIKKSSKANISISKNGKSIKIEKENGEITSMKVDGKEIDPKDYDTYLEEMDIDTEENLYGDKKIIKIKRRGDSMEDIDEEIEIETIIKMDEHMDRLKEVEKEVSKMLKGMENEMELKFRFEDSDGSIDSIFKHKFEWHDNDGEIIRFHSLDMDEMPELEEKMKEMMERMHENSFEFEFDNEDLGEDHKRYKRFFFDMNDLHSSRKSMTVGEAIQKELNEDQLISPGKVYGVELTGKHLKIDGEKQPTNIYEKYKSLFEERTGMTMTKDTKVFFEVEGKKSKKAVRRI